MAEQSKKSSRKTQPTTRTRRRSSSSSTKGLNISFGGCSFDGVADVAAETRKEIANALQLHRSSHNTSVAASARTNGYAAGTIFNTTTAVSNICNCCGSCRCVADCTSCSHVHHHQYCSYSASPMNKFAAAASGGYSYLWQPLVSQPIWSTTSPSVFPVTPASFTTSATNYSTGDIVYNICDEQLQDQDNFNIDWGDKLASSSYTWWFDFLKSLDGGGGGGGSTNGVLVSNYDAADQFFKQQQRELHKEDQNLSSSLEHHDWLIEPASNN